MSSKLFNRMKTMGAAMCTLMLMLLFSTASHATTWPATPTKVAQNPNCYVATGALPPAVSTLIYCGATPPAGNPTLTNTLAAYNGIPSPAAASLKGSGYEVFIFQTFNDYCLEQTPVGGNVAAKCTQLYGVAPNSLANLTGTTSALPTSSVRGSLSLLFETYPTSSPTTTAVDGNYAHSALKQAGHAYDYLFGTGSSYLSRVNQTANGPNYRYTGALSNDVGYLSTATETGVTGNIWQFDVNTYPAYFDITKSSRNDFETLFAEQFAMGASSITQWGNFGQPAYQANPPALDYFNIYNQTTVQNGLWCSDEWVWYHMNHGAAPTLAYLAAQTSNHCYYYGTGFTFQ